MNDIEKILAAANEGNSTISNIVNQAQSSTTSNLPDRVLCHSANSNQNSNLNHRKINENLENSNKQ